MEGSSQGLICDTLRKTASTKTSASTVRLAIGIRTGHLRNTRLKRCRLSQLPRWMTCEFVQGRRAVFLSVLSTIIVVPMWNMKERLHDLKTKLLTSTGQPVSSTWPLQTFSRLPRCIKLIFDDRTKRKLKEGWMELKKARIIASRWML
jgi:hypothetical protein